MENQDQTIICPDCGQEFVFTAGERQFYVDRGFEHPPKRCKPCRTQRKQQQAARNRESAPPQPANNREINNASHRTRETHQPYQRPREAAQRPQQPREAPQQRPFQPREVYVTTCQACGVSTKVPFRPQEGRGVYCPECYHALKALNRAPAEENFP